MPTLRGKKVILRTLKMSDLDKIIEWVNDPEVIQYLQIYLPMSRLKEEKWLEQLSLSEKDVVMAIEAIEDNGNTHYIGNCGLHGISSKDHLATFGIFIGEKTFWSGGYGTEAAKLLLQYGFEQLNLHRVNSMAYAFNERSIRMHVSLGFQIEGCRRQAIWKNNQYQDEVILGLLREEWKF